MKTLRWVSVCLCMVVICCMILFPAAAAFAVSFPVQQPDVWFAVSTDATGGYLYVFDIGVSSVAIDVALSYNSGRFLTFSFSSSDVLSTSSVAVYRISQSGANTLVLSPDLGPSGNLVFTDRFSDLDVTVQGYNFNSQNDNVALTFDYTGFGFLEVFFTGQFDYNDLVADINSSTGNWFTQLFSRLDSWFDSVGAWWTQLFDKLDQLITGGAAGEEFKQEASENAGKLDQAADSMMSQKPGVSGSDMAMDNLLSPDAFNASTSLLSVVFESDFISWQMTVVATLALLSYVLFGKKG